jgi:hypothetical protein
MKPITQKETQKDGVVITTLKEPLKSDVVALDEISMNAHIEAFFVSAKSHDLSTKNFFSFALGFYKSQKDNNLKTAFDTVKRHINSFKDKADNNDVKRLSAINGIAFDFQALAIISAYDVLTFGNIEAIIKTGKVIRTQTENGKVTIENHVEKIEMTMQEALKLLKKVIANVAKQKELSIDGVLQAMPYNNAIGKALSELRHAFGIIETENGLIVNIMANITKLIEGNKLHLDALMELEHQITAKRLELQTTPTQQPEAVKKQA